GWVEAVGMYGAAIAAIGTVGGEYLGRLLGASARATPWLAAFLVALFTGINLVGVSSGRWVQNVVTAAKVLALAGVVVVAFAAGGGAGRGPGPPAAPNGFARWGAPPGAVPAGGWAHYGHLRSPQVSGEGSGPR